MSAVELKREITEKIIRRSKLFEVEKPNFQLLEWKIWKNPWSESSLRLHKFGYERLKEIGAKNSTFSLPPEQLITKTYLLLDKKLSGPYYLSQKKIIVFDDRDAMMLSLLTGNLLQYLEKNSYR